MDETAVLRRRQREVWPAPLCRLTSARALQTEAILREHTAQTRRAITVIRSPTAPSTALAHPQHWPIPSTHCVQATCRCPRVGAAGLFPGRTGPSVHPPRTARRWWCSARSRRCTSGIATGAGSFTRVGWWPRETCTTPPWRNWSRATSTNSMNCRQRIKLHSPTL